MRSSQKKGTGWENGMEHTGKWKYWRKNERKNMQVKEEGHLVTRGDQRPFIIATSASRSFDQTAVDGHSEIEWEKERARICLQKEKSKDGKK